jgi:hypothetical protein
MATALATSIAVLSNHKDTPMDTIDHNTLVTATGGYGPYGSPPFVPEGYLVAAPRWAAYSGYAAYAPAYAAYAPPPPVRWAPMPASWWRSYR